MLLNNASKYYVRKRIRSLIPQRCWLCKKLKWQPIGQLEIHHRDMDPKNGSETNLVMLCPKCHDLIHQLFTLKWSKGAIVRSYLQQEPLK